MQMGDQMHKLAIVESLPFITTLATGKLLLWCPAPSADFSSGCQLGRSYAKSLISFIRTTGDTPILGRILHSICESHRWGSVEIGFSQELAETLFRASKAEPACLPIRQNSRR